MSEMQILEIWILFSGNYIYLLKRFIRLATITRVTDDRHTDK